MRALVVFAHYFKSEPAAAYSSTNEARRAARRASIASVLTGWRAHFGETASLNVEQKKLELFPPVVDTLDLVVLVNRDDHLLDEPLLKRAGVQLFGFNLDQPRMLPFMAHRVLADRKAHYDWFVYSEEDLMLHDPGLFTKLADFQSSFGPRRVLQPHRYEVNAAAERPKIYIDGDLRFSLMKRLHALVDEKEAILSQGEAAASRSFVRALNPHSGFFALSAEQMAHWSAQKHFLDMDCSFVSPLESAATLGLLKTFSVYKPARPVHYLEIEHLDDKFSSMQLPVMVRGDAYAD